MRVAAAPAPAQAAAAAMPEAPAADPPPPPRDVFLAFEGGGARGLAHLGALHAIEAEPSLRPVAYAGTSAGAMVAALAAAGYTAEDLFGLGPRRGRTLLDILNGALGERRYPNATALFGAEGWAHLRWFRHLHGNSRDAVGRGLGTLAAMAAAGLLLWHPLPVLATLGIAGATGFAAWRRIEAGGASLAPVRDAFHLALKLRLAGSGPDGAVTFADLEREGRILKICATNITRGRLELFCAERTPEVAVADAVCASICFPGAFAPWQLRGELFLDGGMLSNLPAWPFDEERRINPDALTIAVAIEEAGAACLPTRAHWFGAAARTLLLGAESLSTRGAGQIEILRLPCKPDLFDFDIGVRRAMRAVEIARDAAAEALDQQVVGVPDDFRRRCADIAAMVQAALSPFGAAFEGGTAEQHIRVALALPEDHNEGGLVRAEAPARSVSLRFGHGFDGDADEGLLFPLAYRGQRAGSVAALAYAEEVAVFHRLPGPESGFDAHYDRRRRLLLRRDLAWVHCVPVTLPAFDRRPVTLAGSRGVMAGRADATKVKGLVIIDGNRPVRDPALLAEALTLVGEAIRPVMCFHSAIAEGVDGILPARPVRILEDGLLRDLPRGGPEVPEATRAEVYRLAKAAGREGVRRTLHRRLRHDRRMPMEAAAAGLGTH
jgi:NTE family protein